MGVCFYLLVYIQIFVQICLYVYLCTYRNMYIHIYICVCLYNYLYHLMYAFGYMIRPLYEEYEATILRIIRAPTGTYANVWFWGNPGLFSSLFEY